VTVGFELASGSCPQTYIPTVYIYVHTDAGENNLPSPSMGEVMTYYVSGGT